VPELVSVSSDNGLRLRTLVLRVEHGHVSYAVLRGSGASLGYPDLTPDPAAQHALGRAVATLVAPDGGEAADQGQALAQFDIGFVLMPGPVNSGLARLLDGVTGLRPVSATSSFFLWRLVDFPARVRVVEAGGKIVPLQSGAISVTDAAVPAAGGTLELAEPAGGWHATLNGRPLTAVRSPAGSWAQAFRLPAGGGLLSIGYDDTGHTAALLLELVAFAAVAMLALPGVGAATGSPAAEISGDDVQQAEPGQPAAPRPRGHRGRGGARARGRAKGRSGRSGRSGRRPEGDRNAVPRPHRPRRAAPRSGASRDAGGPDAAALDAAAGSAAAGSAAAGSAAAGSTAAGARAAGNGGASAAAWDAGWARAGGPARPADSWHASPHPAWHVGQPAARPGGQPPDGQLIPPLPASRTAPPAPGMQSPARPAGPGPGGPPAGYPLDSPSSAGGPLDPAQPGGDRLDPPPSDSGSGPVWHPAQSGDEVSRWPMPGEDPWDDQW
jgi:hypothetical protein